MLLACFLFHAQNRPSDEKSDENSLRDSVEPRPILISFPFLFCTFCADGCHEICGNLVDSIVLMTVVIERRARFGMPQTLLDRDDGNACILEPGSYGVPQIVEVEALGQSCILAEPPPPSGEVVRVEVASTIVAEDGSLLVWTFDEESGHAIVLDALEGHEVSSRLIVEADFAYRAPRLRLLDALDRAERLCDVYPGNSVEMNTAPIQREDLSSTRSRVECQPDGYDSR